MSRRVLDRGRILADCAASFHGTYSAYKHGCRCPHARNDHRIYQKRLREGRAVARRVDSTGTRRRLRALAVLGWRWQDIGDRMGVTWQAAQRLALFHGRVEQPTREQVAAVYRELCERSGPSRVTAKRAAAKGWHGPMAWADIDDPACEPDGAEPESAVVDEWAVGEALAGRLEPSRLGDPDVEEAARRMVADGATAGQVRYRLRLSRARATEVLRAVG